MTFTMQAAMNNAAFDENGGLEELRRCFNRAMDAFDGTSGQKPLRDTNGNYVGFWQLIE